MTGREIFGVVVRTCALLLMAMGALLVLYLGVDRLISSSATFDSSGFWLGSYGAGCFLIGLGLLRFAEFIVRLSYGPRFRKGSCQNCGYDLRGSADRCPECGTPVTLKADAKQP